MKDQPLKFAIEDGRLIISIGVNTLAFADEERTCYLVTDADGFARDVLIELQNEKEDGSTAITDALDKAMTEAVESGSNHVKINAELSRD
jgi:hypothetical protein